MISRKHTPIIIVGATLALSCSLTMTTAITAPPNAPAAPATDKPAATAPAATSAAPDPAVVTAGQKVYDANGCGGCHAIGGKGGDAGPALDKTGVPPTHTIKWMADQVANPKGHNPDSTMPGFAATIKGKDLTSIATYLTTLKGPPETPAAPAAPTTSINPTTPTAPVTPSIPEPTLPPVPAPDASLVALVEKQGASVETIAQTDNHLDVSYHLSGSAVTDASLDVLPRLKNIIQLDLGTTAITDAGLVKLQSLSGLMELHLEKTKVTDKGLASLKSLKSLRYLNLYGTDVTDAGLSSLAGLSKLKHLYLWGTKVTPDGVAGLKKSLPQADIVMGWVEAPKK